MIYSSMLTMCVLMNPLSKKDITLIFWLGQPWDLLLLIWNQKAPAPSPQRVINLDPMNFDYKSKSFNAYTVKCKQFYSTMISSKARIPNGFKSWQRILSFQMRRKFSLFLILLRAERMFGRFNTEYWISFCLRTINCSK